MGVKLQDMAAYLGNPVTRAILMAIVGGELDFPRIVKTARAPREDVAAWLHDMKTKGVVSHDIGHPHSRIEATFSLSSEARDALDELMKPFLQKTEGP